jgi:hypothetical protein
MNERDRKIWDMTYTSTFGALMAGALIARAIDGEEEVNISPKLIEEFDSFSAQAADAAVKLCRRRLS